VESVLIAVFGAVVRGALGGSFGRGFVRTLREEGLDQIALRSVRIQRAQCRGKCPKTTFSPLHVGLGRESCAKLVSAHTNGMMELGRGQARSSACPEAFFGRWIDHDSWPEWSPDTEWVTVQGPVARGTRGVLKPEGGPKTSFEVTACEPGREYTDTSRLLGARLVFQHTAERVHGSTELRVRVTRGGPLARVWAATMGKGFLESAQSDLDRLVRLVEDEQ